MADWSPNDEPNEEDQVIGDSGSTESFRRTGTSDSGSTLSYRRNDLSSGGVDRLFVPFSSAPAYAPHFDSEETSGETVPTWAGSCAAPATTHRTDNYASQAPLYTRENKNAYETGDANSYQGDGQNFASLPRGGGQGLEFEEEPPLYWSPFGSDGMTTTEGSDSYDSEHQDSSTPRVIALPRTFRLERTNFTVTSDGAGVDGLSVESLLAAVRSSLEDVGVDVLDFRPAHCVLECSYHNGNRFLGIFFRVFRAPNRSSGQLLDLDDGSGQQEKEAFLIEAQLREGDRLQFSALFRDVIKAFKNQSGVSIGGTLRYQPRSHPAVGEGLKLEEISLTPSRQSARLLAQKDEILNSAGSPTAGVRRMLTEGAVGGGGAMGASPPLPPGMSKTTEELDVDMADDVILLAGMLSGSFLDVQADAAVAVAGLTADDELIQQLSQDGASRAAEALCTASARLLVETQHRPARRQAAVVVANLCTTPKLRAALLASDPPGLAANATPGAGTAASAGGAGGAAAAAGSFMGAFHLGQGSGAGVGSPDPGALQQVGLVDRLVALAMGEQGGVGGGGGGGRSEMRLRAAMKKEEEIGMRRECMRALVGLAECSAARNTASIKSLLSSEPIGRGATDPTLIARLEKCRTLLNNSC